jgi:hypothetical protein
LAKASAWRYAAPPIFAKYCTAEFSENVESEQRYFTKKPRGKVAVLYYDAFGAQNPLGFAGRQGHFGQIFLDSPGFWEHALGFVGSG